MTLRAQILLACLMIVGTAFPVCAQGVVLQQAPGGTRVVATPAGSPGKPPEKPAGDKKSDKPDTGKGESEEKKPDDKGSKKTILRSEYKPQPYVEPFPVDQDATGRVKFNFHGTPWPVVLDWLARFSRLNLDWQELPGDFLNLRTQQSYTDLEARDLLNRHLLTRGYTLLQHGELLTVVKVQGLNPGLVPRVSPENLSECQPHEYVKVSLPLEWILADEAVEQLKPMLSPNGQLNAISAVNRLEAMDVAVNLQEIYQLLNDEQSGHRPEKGLVREFKLQHVRAGNVIDSLYGILGIKKPQSFGGGSNDISGSMSMQIMQQLQQIQQRQSQQRGNSSGSAKEETEPRLVLNERENSILAHASPDKMEIISQTIEAMDVPSERQSHILQNLDRMKVYRLSTLKPDPLVKILTEIGDLSPTTKIQVDSENNSVIVYGSLADHVTVQSLVERLDGSSRNFEVIPLRRLRARDVAGTIQYMLGEEEEEDDNSGSRFFGYYSYRSQPQKEKEERPFRVDADVENNRLLVWANEVEIEEIQNLLIKMGEIPAGKTNPATMRTIDLHSDDEATEILNRIERLWEQNKSNELRIEKQVPKASVAPEPAQPDPQSVPVNEVQIPVKPLIHFATERTAVVDSPQVPSNDDQSTAEQLPGQQPHPLSDVSDSEPPVTIRVLPDGRLHLESNDPRALDELELMISELAPPAPNYKIYPIKFAWPFGVELILVDFFESEDDEEQILDWWGNTRNINKKTPDRLSTKRKLKIISDDDSRTILVQGATAEQLAIIEDLIEIYDRPESSDPQSVRVTKVFHLEYSQAQIISETVKAVYRDLLSSNDKAFQTNQKEGQQQPQSQGMTFLSPFRQNSDGGEKQEQPQEPIKFKGLLSIGVDEVSNTVVVSAASGLMDDISQLIQVLDLAARPSNTVKVLSVNPSIKASFLKERLNQSFGFQSKVKVSTTAGNGKNGSDQEGGKQGNDGPRAVPNRRGGNQSPD